MRTLCPVIINPGYEAPEARVHASRVTCEAGVYLGKTRFGYGSALGEGISRDPSGERGGINLYGYVANEPIGEIDPFGLEKGDFGDGDWEPTILSSEPGTGYGEGEPASLQYSYTESAQEKQCCKSFNIQRFVTWLYKQNDPDGPPGDPSINGVGYSTPDQPGWFGGHAPGIRIKIKFTWVARCSSGKALSEITKIWTSQNGKGTLSNP